MITYGLPLYHKAFNRIFWDHHHSCKHISEVGIKDRINNNKLERLHDTIRDRDKVMRGLDNPDSSQIILDGHQIYYNFIKPHMALNGKTPAQMAGLDLDLGDNKWLSLIEKSIKHKEVTTKQSTVRGQQTLNGG